MNKEVIDWLDKHCKWRICPGTNPSGIIIVILGLHENHNAEIFFFKREPITVERLKEKIYSVLKEILTQYENHVWLLNKKLENLKSLD